MCRKKDNIFLIVFTTAVLLGFTCFVSYNLIRDNDTLTCESVDYTNHSAYSQIDNFEDDIPDIEPIAKLNQSAIFTGFQSKATRSFTRTFYLDIWRPPKIS